MKGYLKKITVALLAVVLFTSLASYAYAANTWFKSFEVTGYPGSYSTIPTAEKKLDSSPMVIRVDPGSVGGSYYVRANAHPSETSITTINCTVHNNQLADHVVCNKGTYYSVKNVVRENGYVWSSMSIAQYSSYGRVYGVWAPDSDQTFATPSAP